MEAAATPITKIVSLKDTATTQEGVVLKENDADVHALMATSLPQFVMIQSNLNNLYVHLYTENPDVPNALRYNGDYSFDLDTRFEVVPTTGTTGFVHIRCLRNNKYWASFDKQGVVWVTATADKPEESQSDIHSTLFDPVFVNSNSSSILKLRHVQTGKFVRLWNGDGHYIQSLFLTEETKDDDTCTFIDWEDVVMLPDIIRIKGDNGNYLRDSLDQPGLMDFVHQADNSTSFDYEVSPSRDGGIRLKSVALGTYWTADKDYEGRAIQTKPGSPTVDNLRSVFKPTIIDGNRIIMQCLDNGYFCERFTGGVVDCLYAYKRYPEDASYLDIEEPVISRKISNVVYHLSDARIYNEKSLALITDDTSNRTSDPLESKLDLNTTVSNTTNWSTSASTTLGVSVSVTFGIPFIESGEISVSAEHTKSSAWGGEETVSIAVGTTKTITLPPMTRVKGTLMATRCSYDIPFSYTQHDKLKSGTKRSTIKNDGLFTANDGYNYKYDIIPLPLEDL